MCDLHVLRDGGSRCAPSGGRIYFKSHDVERRDCFAGRRSHELDDRARGRLLSDQKVLPQLDLFAKEKTHHEHHDPNPDRA